MEIQATPDSMEDGRAPHPRYSNSVVWSRTTAGIFDYEYEVIQIVDGNSQLLQPAYDDFVAKVDELTNGEMYANTVKAGVTESGKCF